MSYRLPYGREVPPSTVDNHHAIFYRRWYKTPHEKLYRGLAGLVLPIHRPIHNQLHAEVPPPPKPSREFMLQIVDHSQDIDDSRPYQRFLEIVKFVGDVANTAWSDERVDEASRLYENLNYQDNYLKQGVLTRVDDERA